MKIYLKNIERKKSDSLFRFLVRCLTKENGNVGGTFPETYIDEECTIIQCKRASRSFDSIIDISQTYFKVSKKQVAKALEKIILKYPNRNFGFLLCKAAQKWVFYCTGYIGLWKQVIVKYPYVFTYGESIDKVGDPGIGEHTYNDIFELMNS